MPKQEFDTARHEAFAERLIGTLNSGALCLMISIGHRTGLFDALADLPPSSAAAVAEKANLQERYVREWLNAMVTGDVVEYDSAAGTYRLPAEHAAWLTRAAESDNVAVLAQFIPELAHVEEQIITCFREGGGVPYEAYPRFHEVMAESSDQTVLSAIDSAILPLVPGLIDRLREGIDILEVGCGSGRAACKIAKLFPHSRIVAYDLSEEAIERAQAEAKRLDVENVRFEVRDLTDFPVDGKYDLVLAFDAIHDQARPDTVLEGIARVLKSDGTFLMQDIAGSSHVHLNSDHPIGPLMYTVSCLHCMTVSLAQGGMGLGAMWGEEKAREMLAEAGFRSVKTTHLPHDMESVYYVATLEESATGTLVEETRTDAA